MSLYRPGPAWRQENNSINRTVVTGDPLSAIYNEGTWRLSKVSPLYNLQYDTVKLKQYASKIRQALVSEVAAHSSIKYVVQIEERANLKYCEDDASALFISVLSSTQEKNSSSKVSYTAIMLSWGISITLDKATHLPYMLERGEQRIGTPVKTSLQTIFDCQIIPFNFTQKQLFYFGFNFVDNDSSRNTDPFTLIYRKVDHKEKLKLSFEFGDIQIIWNGIKDEIEPDKTDMVNMVKLAYQMLQNQIFHTILLDITVLNLSEVTLPRAEVKSSGVVKMKTPEIVNCVFTVLNEINHNNIYYDQDSSDSPGNLRRFLG